MKKFATIDLFAGAGGLSYGFLKTGCYDIKVAVEHNKHAQKTYLKQHVNTHLESDIRMVDYKELIEKYGKFEIVIGGPPCQGFSNANRQKNELVSSNNQLVNEYIRAIEELQPTAFVMENVKSINSKKHKFFCNERIENEIISLGVPLNDEVIAIAEETIIPDQFIGFLNSCTNFKPFMLSKDIYVKINTIFRNTKSSEQLVNYISKYEIAIDKLIKGWDILQTEFWNEEYKRVFTETKYLLINYTSKQQDFSLLKSNLATVVETQKAIYKMQEIRNYGIKLLDIKRDKKNICIVAKMYNVIDYVLKKFETMGYKVAKGVLNAAHFGVPQNRERFIVVGIKEKALRSKKIKLPDVIFDLEQDFYTIEDAIHDLEKYTTTTIVDGKPIKKKKFLPLNPLQAYLNDSDLLFNHVVTDTRETALERFKNLEPGQNFHDLDESLKTTYSDPTRTQNTIYLRLKYKDLSGTVLNVRKSMWIHPKNNRAISIREAARLQSFPDSFVFCGTKDAQYQQVGNAVPPLLGQAIAENLLELLGIQPVEKLKDIIVNYSVEELKCVN